MCLCEMSLWVIDTFEWQSEARLAPSEPDASAFVFVASCLSKQFALPGTLLLSRGKENATNARYLVQCWVRNRKTSSAQTEYPK